MQKVLKKVAVFSLILFFGSAISGLGNLRTADAEVLVPDKKEAAKNFYSNNDPKIKEIEQRKMKSKLNVIKDKKPAFVKDEILVKFKKDKIDIEQFLRAGQSPGLKMETQKSPSGGNEKSFKAAIENSSVEKQIGDFAKKFSLEKKSYIARQNLAVMKIKDGKSVENKIKALKSDPNVERVQPNFKYSPTAINPGNDTDYANQWGLNNTGQTLSIEEKLGYGSKITADYTGIADADIDAPEAWAVSEGDNSKIVAVIDTGVAYNHPDLVNNMWDGTDCLDENGDAIPGGCPNHGWDYDTDYLTGEIGDNDPSPGHNAIGWFGFYYYYSSHGTHVAGIIAGTDNDTGIVGVAPHAQIMAVKTADLYTDEIIKGIAFAENNDAKIINASWGGYGEDQDLKDAIAKFDGLFVAAAGNESLSGLIPCALDLDNVICVAATDQDDQLTSWSNYSDTEVDVAAPGDNILSAVGDFDYAYDDFNGLTPPGLPSGFTASGGSNWQSRDVTSVMMNGMFNFGSSYKNVIYGDNFNPYSDNGDTTLTSDAIDFSEAKKADMYFNAACDTQYDASDWFDYMALEFSNDGGGSWNEISRWDEAVLGLEQKGGYNTGTFDVNDIDSSYFTDNFKYRFRWVSDGADNNYGGCFIDGMWSTIYSKGYPAYDYYSGTSMATPMTAGLAALVWSSDDNLTKEQIKDIILYTGDSLDSLDGKTVTGKRINAQKAVEKLSDSSAPTVTKLGDGAVDYAIAADNSAELAFSEALAVSSRNTIETAIANELTASGFAGTASYSWNKNGDTVTISVSGARALFKNDVTASVSDIVGNEASNLLIDSSADETAPAGSININNGRHKTSNKYATLYLKATDNVGVYRMRFSNNGSRWSGWKEYKTRYYNWNLTNSTYGGNGRDGTKYVYVQFEDRAGNASKKYRDSIKFDD